MLAVFFIFISLGFSYWISIVAGFRSWTSTSLLDFENARLLAHFLFYIAGIMCYRRNVFAELPKSKTIYIVASSVAWLPVTGHFFVRLWPFSVPEFIITPLYWFQWFLSFHLTSLLMVYVMVESFRLYVIGTGKLWDLLNRNFYGVYIIHGILGIQYIDAGYESPGSNKMASVDRFNLYRQQLACISLPERSASIEEQPQSIYITDS